MNAYPIIIGLVILGGIGVTALGWQIMRQSKKVREWPSIEGLIIESEPTSELDELLPHIVYSYKVDDQTLQQTFEFPSGTNPMPEFAQAYVKKYPLDAKVQVFYNPQQPQQSTLEPGAQGDWMVLALGIMMAAGGAAALLAA